MSWMYSKPTTVHNRTLAIGTSLTVDNIQVSCSVTAHPVVYSIYNLTNNIVSILDNTSYTSFDVKIDATHLTNAIFDTTLYY